MLREDHEQSLTLPEEIETIAFTVAQSIRHMCETGMTHLASFYARTIPSQYIEVFLDEVGNQMPLYEELYEEQRQLDYDAFVESVYKAQDAQQTPMLAILQTAEDVSAAA